MIVEKFSAQQIESIINKVVPLIADPEDYEFFRGVLFVKADSCKSSSEFSYFISKLLKKGN
jgi:hypothetical protein